MSQKIYVSIEYSNNFIKKFIPALLTKKLSKKSLEKQYTNMFKYIEENYEIKRNDIFKNLLNNLHFNKYNKQIIISCDNNAYINNTKIDELLRLIDFGNSTIKGTNLISEVVEWLNTNMYYLYRVYLKVQTEKNNERR